VSERKEEEDDGEGLTAFDQGEIAHGVEQLSLGRVDEDALLSQIPRREPRSALEHFERAVEKEAEGNLGDSLHHYRKAYRVRILIFFWSIKRVANSFICSLVRFRGRQDIP
jgi:F-box protein 9